MKLNIQGKLILAFGIILLLALGTSVYLIFEIRMTANNYAVLINRKAYSYAWIETSLAQYNEAAANLRGFVITGNPEHDDLYRQGVRDGDTYVDKVSSQAMNEKEKQLMEQYKSKIPFLKQYGDEVIRLVKAREAASGNQRELLDRQLMEYSHQNGKIVANLTATGETLAKNYESELLSENINIKKMVETNISLSIILVSIAIIIGLLFAYFIARMISNPIRLIDNEAAKIASGDLTGEKIKLKTKDEAESLAQSFNLMLSSLREIAYQLKEKSQLVFSSASELTASAENVAAGSNETASSITLVAGNVEQVTVNVQRISDVSKQATDYAKEGRDGIVNVVLQMEGIQIATDTTSQAIDNLYNSASKISQIVEMITNIADQTNLLALNAAIEAARAGEQGRGFAVVAEEVRKLAEQSSASAKEIHTLTTCIHDDVQKAVQVMDEGADKVEKGSKVVKDVGGTFENIITAVQGLAGDIQSIATAIEDVSSTVQTVAAASQEQTATMDEVSSTSQDLTRMAEELEVLVERFKLS